MEVHKRLKNMGNDVCILQSMGKADEDKELLLELLKESRKLLMKRIAEQSRKIVELTASRNELLAEVNGVGDMAELQVHVADMEENARKMTAELESLRETLSQRTADIEALQKSLEHKVYAYEEMHKVAKDATDAYAAEKNRSGELLQELEAIRANGGKTTDNEAVEGLKEIIKELRAEKAALNKEVKKLRSEAVGLRGKVGAYEIMAKYAKVKGVKFRQMHTMKQTIKEAEEKDKTLVEIFKDMDTDCEKMLNAIDETVPQQAEQTVNTVDYSDAVAMDKQDCPWDEEQGKGKVAIVGGRYCRTKCPYNEGVNEDENFVHCSKSKK